MTCRQINAQCAWKNADLVPEKQCNKITTVNTDQLPVIGIATEQCADIYLANPNNILLTNPN